MLAIYFYTDCSVSQLVKPGVLASNGLFCEFYFEYNSSLLLLCLPNQHVLELCKYVYLRTTCLLLPLCYCGFSPSLFNSMSFEFTITVLRDAHGLTYSIFFFLLV